MFLRSLVTFSALIIAITAISIPQKEILGNKFAEAFAPEANVTQHYGYIEVNPQYDSHLFYWMFESQHPSNDLVMWLTGGPGCASEVALFFENGPFKIDKTTLELYPNPYSWNTNANLLYVDQPAGTGFSYASSDYIKNETMVATEMFTFLTKFFEQYPQYHSMNFFITGESYAGHYIPAIGARIVKENEKKQTINLQALAIGDGLIDTEVIAGSWAPFLYGNGKITKTQMENIQSTYWSVCEKDIDNQDWASAFQSCNNVLGASLQAAGNINVYDIRKQCTYPPLCYDLTFIGTYLNQPSVQKKLGVNKKWESCNFKVYGPFETDDFDYSYRFDLPKILEKHRMLIYNGNYDLVVDFYGTSATLNQMNWKGQVGFLKAKNETWTVDGTVAGSARTFDKLTYLVVDNAGHMVPHDQPKNALNMLERFLKNQPFD